MSGRLSPGRTVVTLLAVAGLVVLAPASGAGGGRAVSPDRLAAMAEEREAFGLPTDAATMTLLLAGADVGTTKWGIPMTVEEEASIDLPARMGFANEVAKSIAPYVEGLATYGGLYFDQRGGGRLTVLLTRPDAAVEDTIRGLMPASSRGLTIGYVAHRYAELEAAVPDVWRLWQELGNRMVVEGVSVDTEMNELRIDVASTDREAAEPAATAIAERLGLRVVAAVSDDVGEEVVCNSRDECYNPIKAGTRIRKGAAFPGEAICSMGFQVEYGSTPDIQFLTAGHCGFSGSNDWYQRYWGRLGNEEATLYREGGQDAMRVGIQNGQATNKLFGVNRPVEGFRNPLDGETICASLGHNPDVAYDCGTVTDAVDSWIGDACGCTIYGADGSGISAVTGDSGSPIVTVGPGTYSIAIGILNLSTGQFAKMQNVLGAWCCIDIRRS